MYSLDCVNFETVKDQNGNDMVSCWKTRMCVCPSLYVINIYHRFEW